METEKVIDIRIPPEFIEDFPQLSKSGIALYLVLRKLVGEEEGDVWVHRGYDQLLMDTGFKSKTNIRKGIIELVSTGWIIGFNRGWMIKKKRIANQYLVAAKRNATPDPALLEKVLYFESKRHRSTSEDTVE